MLKTIVVALTVVLTIVTVISPVVRASGPQVAIVDGADEDSKSSAYLDFYRIFSTTFIDSVEKNAEQNQNLAHDYWVILMYPVLSLTGDTLIEIHATRVSEPKQLPVLIAVLSERSEAATVRTAARSAQRLIAETAMQRSKTPSLPPPPTPPAQKLKTNNPRTKHRAGVSLSMLS